MITEIMEEELFVRLFVKHHTTYIDRIDLVALICGIKEDIRFLKQQEDE